MYLKRLELQGFKSFPEKIRLEFNKGITAVVGPNGSGKSNVSDAVRWALGEQSAKSLRGSKMEDVIFAGTSSRRPLGFAEVSMILDNGDGKIPLDYNEITITRRVYRSGESQFLINGSNCRLKDIRELFMDTGIGREGYSIIGQGRIEEILSAKSEDRRLLFEEAAGIVKYKNRKYEAEAKLEKEKQNLLRVDDLILELEKQLEPLFKASEKARKFLAVTERLKLVKVNIFLQETQKITNDAKRLANLLDDISQQIKNAENEQLHRKNETETIKYQIDCVVSEIEKANQSIAGIKSEIEHNENNIKLLEQQIMHLVENVNRIKKEITGREKLVEIGIKDISLYESKLAAEKFKIASQNDFLSEAELDFKLYSGRLAESELLIDKYSAEHIDRLRETSDIKGKIQRAEMRYEQLEQRKEELLEERRLTNARINENEIKIQSIDKTIKEKDQKIFFLKQQNDSITLDYEKLENDITKADAHLQLALKRLSEIQSRSKLLTELESGYEGYYRSVKSVLKEKMKNPQTFAGVFGAIGELITVEEKFETAIEIALGGAIQDIVTKTEADAQLAIDHLKRTKDGRATFLPLTSIQPKDIGSIKERLLWENGILGVAKDMIQYENQYEPVMSNLLGRVLVFESLDKAIAFSKAYKYSYKCVTIEGDLINPGGALTGGSYNKSGSHILSRAREISELDVEIVALQEQNTVLSTEIKEKSNIKNSMKDLINKNRMTVQETELEKASFSATLSQSIAILEEFREQRKDYNIEERQIMEQIVEQNRQIRQFNTERELIELEIADILKTMDERQTAVVHDKEKKEEKAKEVANIRVSLSAMTQNAESIRENITRLEKEMCQYRLDIQNNEIEILRMEKEKEDNHSEIEVLLDEIDDLKTKIVIKQKMLEELAQNKSELSHKLQVIEVAAMDKIELLSQLGNEKVRLEVKKEQTEQENKRLYNEMWEEYNITYQSALQYESLHESLTKLQNEEREIKNKMREMGNVNISAIDEYKLVSERHTFMTKQRNDIVEAEEALVLVINELCNLMERQFMEQFKIISQNFDAVFKEMFGGGKADLILSNESDVLSSGIDIVAQMPGKSLQNMMLFSGGERALTAIALLFAILRMKPSPFCILDEIEAALDDANVRRFASYLRNFTEDTQFIVITHRKGTMEAADVLYGVTMQEQGVSKLVSVKLNEAVS